MSPCESCFDSRNSFKRFPTSMMVSSQSYLAKSIVLSSLWKWRNVTVCLERIEAFRISLNIDNSAGQVCASKAAFNWRIDFPWFELVLNHRSSVLWTDRIPRTWLDQVDLFSGDIAFDLRYRVMVTKSSRMASFF